MSRSMIDANKKFFENIINSVGDDNVEYIAQCPRYISTDENSKSWLKNAKIKRIHRFSKSTCALLIEHGEYYICTVNVNVVQAEIDGMVIEPVNAGLATLLGSEGYLTNTFSVDTRAEIFDKVLYDTYDIHEYAGHNWEDIKGLFPSINCFRLKNMTQMDFDRNAFYSQLCKIAYENELCNNPMSVISRNTWEKVFYESNESLNYNHLLLAYTALSWDLTYLYLYQCLEDKFVEESVKKLNERLGVDLSEKELGHILYQELEWQPRDIESIERIIQGCSSESIAIKLLTECANGEKLPKFVYSVRNEIVHETRDPMIGLDANDRWEKLITGMLNLIKDI